MYQIKNIEVNPFPQSLFISNIIKLMVNKYKLFFAAFGFAIFFLLGLYLGKSGKTSFPSNPLINDRPLDKYTIENLAKATVPKGKFEIKETLDKQAKYNSYLFDFSFDPTLTGKVTRRTSGQINIPNKNGPFPLIVMIRGYVDKETYQTGIGTKNGAAYFAENGFMTVAPDFLGYGFSDPDTTDVMEARFQTYTTILSLLSSVDQISNWDHKNVFIWAHSNGGQIALTALEVTGKNYPAVLWAPVSKPFPYSILYYTDDSEDGGKFLISQIAKFEEDYDPSLYSLTNYLNLINAKIEVHQGTADESVPISWSNDLVSKLKDLGKDITYYTYPGADHNLRPSWNTAVSRSLQFYKDNLDTQN